MQFKATGESGFIVNYDVSAEDTVDGSIAPDCVPEQGIAFQIGDTVVKCTAEDEAGNEATKSFVVVVSPLDNTLPQAILTPPSGQTEAAEELSFTADRSADPGGSIVDYSWDFGDGAKGNGVSVTHTYQNPGTYTVTLEVTDDKNGKSSDIEELTIVGATTTEVPTVTTTEVPTAGDPNAMMTYGIVGAAAAAAGIGGIVAVKKINQKKADMNIP
jgi:PKD repeat protein